VSKAEVKAYNSKDARHLTNEEIREILHKENLVGEIK
jgi:hypothetical protein